MPGDDFSAARSLRSPQAVVKRQLRLRAPHMAKLTEYVDNLRLNNRGLEFPYFDPLDGGDTAEVLFLFEKPGPRTSAQTGGSGFISRDNDDPTAEATLGFMKEAGLPRKRTVIWNVVPGWNHTRKVTALELRQGVEALRSLLPLLPKIATIVLVGQRAQRAMPLIQQAGLRILTSAHPSPLVRASQPEVWRDIPKIWMKVEYPA